MKLPEGIAVGVCSHTGLVRGANEDDYLLATTPWQQGHAVLAAVADGMGGVAGGAEASRMALRSLGAALVGVDDEEGADERMRRGFRSANARVCESGAAVPALRDMGTTLTALWLFDDEFVVGHIGDSRLYHVRGNRCEALTTDHAVAEGESLLTRCIGGGQLDCECDAMRLELAAGDRFVLVTDGVWNVVPEPLFLAAISGREAQETADRLVQLALDAGAPDNATAMVLDIIDPGTAAEVDVELPRLERPDVRSLYPPAVSLRPPVWPWLLLVAALLLFAYAAMRWFGLDPLAMLAEIV